MPFTLVHIVETAVTAALSGGAATPLIQRWLDKRKNGKPESVKMPMFEQFKIDNTKDHENIQKDISEKHEEVRKDMAVLHGDMTTFQKILSNWEVGADAALLKASENAHAAKETVAGLEGRVTALEKK